MNTGVDDINKVGLQTAWDYSSQTVFPLECGQVRGSFGDEFPPNSTAGDQIFIFANDLCRYCVTYIILLLNLCSPIICLNYWTSGIPLNDNCRALSTVNYIAIRTTNQLVEWYKMDIQLLRIIFSYCKYFLRVRKKSLNFKKIQTIWRLFYRIHYSFNR